ncbi:hypothetical protein SteCoe_14416 [Stentor coeruleus]|uniref:Importin subunit alpha n=1 Tax=Stentor coeruleus TaxID=5963 RepID=A0A1R2C607_9CILI|nr:hypothetical protein SteCoe_14416 [Stentor coeruleus]
MEERSRERRERFQKMPTPNEIKQHREFFAIELRKKKRSDHIKKKRATADFNYTQIPGNFDFPICIVPDILSSAITNLKNIKLDPMQRLYILTESILDIKDHNLINAILYTFSELSKRYEGLPYDCIFHQNQANAFINILRSDDINLQIFALGIIVNACTASYNIVARFKQCGIFEELTRIIKNIAVPDIVEHAFWVLGNIISDRIEDRDEVIKRGLWIDCIENSKSTDDGIRKKCFWVLSNICSCSPLPPEDICKKIFCAVADGFDSEDKEILIPTLNTSFFLSDNLNDIVSFICRPKYLKILMNLLNSKDNEILLLVTKIIGNIGGSTDKHSKLLVEFGFLEKAIQLISHSNNEVKCEVFYTISNLLASTEEVAETIILGPIMPLIIENASSQNKKVQFYALASIYNVSHLKKKNLLRILIDYNATEILIKGLDGENIKQQFIVLKTLQNVFSFVKDYFDGEKLQEFKINFADLDGVGKLEDMTNSRDTKVKSEAQGILLEHFIQNQEIDMNLGLQNRPTSVYAFN